MQGRQVTSVAMPAALSRDAWSWAARHAGEVLRVARVWYSWRRMRRISPVTCALTIFLSACGDGSRAPNAQDASVDASRDASRDATRDDLDARDDASSDGSSMEGGEDPPFECGGVVGGNVIHIAGEPGEYVSGGQTFTIVSNGTWTPTVWPYLTTAPHSVVIDYQERKDGGPGEHFWGLRFSSEKLAEPLAVQAYPNATRYDGEVGTTAGLDVYGNGAGCSSLTGAFEVHELVMDGTALESFGATFSQTCFNAFETKTMTGCVHFQAGVDPVAEF